MKAEAAQGAQSETDWFLRFIGCLDHGYRALHRPDHSADSRMHFARSLRRSALLPDAPVG